VSKGLAEITSELNIHVGHNGLKQTVQFNDTIEKDFDYSTGVRSTRARQEVGHFRKMIQ